jgi:MYXO-CTERM domain-containing protein
MDLPQTATGFVGTIFRGMAMLVVGLLGLAAGRRRRASGTPA